MSLLPAVMLPCLQDLFVSLQDRFLALASVFSQGLELSVQFPLRASTEQPVGPRIKEGNPTLIQIPTHSEAGLWGSNSERWAC